MSRSSGLLAKTTRENRGKTRPLVRVSYSLLETLELRQSKIVPKASCGLGLILTVEAVVSAISWPQIEVPSDDTILAHVSAISEIDARRGRNGMSVAQTI